MTSRRLAKGALALLAGFLVAAPPLTWAKPDGAGLARALAQRLRHAPRPRPQTHTTDFATDALGCIAFTNREMRDLGYRGHAFVCEEATTGEVLGALLSPSGSVRCYVTGAYVGDGCYHLDICDDPQTVCF